MARTVDKLAKNISFGIKKVFIVFILSFVLWFVTSITITAFIQATIKPRDASYIKHFLSQPQVLSIYLLFYCFFAGLFTWFLLIKKINSRVGLFFDKEKIKEDLIYGFGLFIKSLGVVVIFFMCLIFLFAVVSKVFGLNYELIKNTYIQGREAEVSEIFRICKPNAIIIFMLIIFAPFYEEIFYRGCLYTVLRRRFTTVKSIMLSSLFFALVHGYVFNFFPVFILGIILSYAYEKRASLTAPLALHFCWNVFSAMIVFFKV